jgi:hypothetical protein
MSCRFPSSTQGTDWWIRCESLANPLRLFGPISVYDNETILQEIAA